jgi:hypothetical protein
MGGGCCLPLTVKYQNPASCKNDNLIVSDARVTKMRVYLRLCYFYTQTFENIKKIGALSLKCNNYNDIKAECVTIVLVFSVKRNLC